MIRVLWRGDLFRSAKCYWISVFSYWNYTFVTESTLLLLKFSWNFDQNTEICLNFSVASTQKYWNLCKIMQKCWNYYKVSFQRLAALFIGCSSLSLTPYKIILLTKDTAQFALAGKLWGVSCNNFWENWPRVLWNCPLSSVHLVPLKKDRILSCV